MFTCQFPYQGADFTYLDRIESYRGLIENDKRGGMYDSLGNTNALLESLGQIANQTPADLSQSATLPGGIHSRTAFAAGDAVYLRTIAKIFIYGQLAVEWRLLGQIAKLRLGKLRLIEHIDPVDLHQSRAGGEIATDDLHGSGFAGAIRAEKTQYLAAFDLKADIVYGTNIAVIAIKVFNPGQTFHTHAFLLTL